MIKIAAPNMACKVVDWAIQAFGGAGTNNDYGLAAMYATARLLRLADGPDEVHRNQLGKLELRRHAEQGPDRAAQRLLPHVARPMTGARESGAMNQVPHPVDHQDEERDSHDGLAAVAISLLFVALVVFMVSQLL